MKSLLHCLLLIVLVLGEGVRASPKVRGLLAENRIEDAVIACREAEALASNDNDTLAACAWAYYRGNRPDAGDRVMETLKRNPGSQEFQLLQAFAKMQRKQYADARILINQLLNEYRVGPFGLTVQEVSAELYDAQGQADTAAFLYKQIANDDPKRGRAQWGLGRYYLTKGDLPRARGHLETAASLWPKHLGTRYNLAVLSLNQENYAEAARWLAECYKLDRADPGVLEQMGVLFEKKGKLKEAMKYWRRAVDLRKDAPIAKAKLEQYAGQVAGDLAKEKRYAEALDQLEAAPSKKDAKKRLKRGVLYRNMGKFDKAIGDLLAYSKAYPRDPLVHRELGICYLNTKLLNQAAASFTRAIELEPESGLNYAWLGFVLEGKGKLLEAREAWKKAIELLGDAQELEKATRRLAAVEEKLKERKRDRKEKEEDGDDSRDLEKEIENMDIFEGVDGIPQ